MVETSIASTPSPSDKEEPAHRDLHPVDYAFPLTHEGALPHTFDPTSNVRHRALAGHHLRPSRTMSAPDFRRQLTIDQAEHGTPPPLTHTATRPALITKSFFEPSKPIGKVPGWRASAKAAARYSWLNVLLVFVPASTLPACVRCSWLTSSSLQISWAMHFSGQSSTVIFICSFAAIVPLAALLGFATEEMALRVGDTFGGVRVSFLITSANADYLDLQLLNATFGNCVELIISILALVKGELRIVQSSMVCRGHLES